MGKIDPADLRTELREALKGVESGKLAGPVKISTGFAILKVEESATTKTSSAPAAVLNQQPAPVMSSGQGMTPTALLALAGRGKVAYPPDVSGAVEVEVAVGAGATNVEVDIGTVVLTKIQSIVINADKAPMDVYTNDAAGSTGQHFALAANKSIAWNTNMNPPFTNPITANITKFYGNNSSLIAGTLRVGILLNS